MNWPFILFLLSASSVFSRTHDLLKCLGQEERKLHLSKTTGPTYELNQKLIAEIIQIPHVQITETHLKEICDSSFGPSWKLLELSLFEGDKLFINNETGMQKNINESMIKEYLEASREILLGLISSVQTLSKDPNCLIKNFRSLDEFYVDLKYLQEELSSEKIFQGREKKIFKDLKKYQKILKKCQVETKKKRNSSPTAPRK